MINHELIERMALFGFETTIGINRSDIQWTSWEHDDKQPMAEQLYAEARGMA